MILLEIKINNNNKRKASGQTSCKHWQFPEEEEGAEGESHKVCKEPHRGRGKGTASEKVRKPREESIPRLVSIQKKIKKKSHGCLIIREK